MRRLLHQYAYFMRRRVLLALVVIKRSSLVDRGANGGLGGSDVMTLSCSLNRTVLLELPSSWNILVVLMNIPSNH